jgi:hypothetical protein
MLMTANFNHAKPNPVIFYLGAFLRTARRVKNGLLLQVLTPCGVPVFPRQSLAQARRFAPP